MDDLYYLSGALYCSRDEKKRKYYYEDGTPKTVESYEGGRLHGESFLYWPNGKLKRKCNFIGGVRDGIDQMWNQEGVLVDEGFYELGKPVGLHRRFNSAGALIEEIEYLNGSQFNLRSWDDAGELKVEAIWTDPETYREKAWDRFENIWVEKEGYWDGKKLVYV
jgi:antitoxin component YwqK of YwqJK toxin-antitoxin module